jgi:glutathione S-transferase
MTQSQPILYSFRRCPYAIRARMTLSYAGVELEHREVLLRDKPQAMLDASSKATVPILHLPDGRVIDESFDVMRWALEQNDKDRWWRNELVELTLKLVEENDLQFKSWLDRYKYADRYPQQSQQAYRKEAEKFVCKLESKLETQAFLVDKQMTFSDVAIFPFIRQFAFVDKAWFDQAPYPKIQSWLQSFLDSTLFTNVMQKHPTWQQIET